MEVHSRLSFYFYQVFVRREVIRLLSPPPLSPSSSSSPAKISFRFVHCTTEYIFDAEAQTFMRPVENHENLPVFLAELSVLSEIVENGNEEFYRCVSESLEILALDAETIYTLTTAIITDISGLKQEQSISHPNFGVLPLSVKISRVDFLYIEIRMRGSTEELTESEAHHGMVPASENSTRKMLKRVTVTGIEVQEESEVKECAGGCKRRRINRNRKAETCMICLEEMRVGSRATQVPCSHLFHTKCITKWLRANHYCPLCRFEFPREDTN